MSKLLQALFLTAALTAAGSSPGAAEMPLYAQVPLLGQGPQVPLLGRGPQFEQGPVLAQRCLSPGQARDAAQSGQVLPLSALVGQIRQAAGGQIVDWQLCQRGGGFVYELSVLVAGTIRRVTVDASSGSLSF